VNQNTEDNLSRPLQGLESEGQVDAPLTDEPARHELVQLVYSYGGSTRLRNSLVFAQNQGLLEGLSIQKVLDGDPKQFRVLWDIPNLGIKCLNELKTLAVRATGSTNHSPTLSNPGKDQQRVSHQSESSITSALAEVPITNVVDVLEELSSNAKQVIQLRLGLNGEEPKTLAAIGDAMDVTRERIRQIEAKSLKRLKQSFNRTFTQMLLSRQTATLARFSVHQVIRHRDETQLFRSLDPDARLLITVTLGSVQTWFDAVCTRIDNGWLLPTLSIEAYAYAQRWIAERLVQVQLPCSKAILQIPGAPAEEAILAVLHLAKNIRLFGNYLLPARSTRRARRAVRAHELMLRGGVASLSLPELRDRYCREYQDDPCSARDLLIVMSDNPHMFLNQYEFGWFALGVCSPDCNPMQSGILPQEGGLEVTSDEDEPPGPEAETLRGTLAQILLEHGPQSFNDLRRRFIKVVGARYSKASVGPVLISSDEFVRIGPGIYAHRRQLQDHALLKFSGESLLLNKAQLETFCRALWAGESPQSYILWTCEMQVHWAEWAHQNDHKQLLSSLLAVCDIGSWPVKAGDQARWVRLRDRMGVYLLEEPHPSLTARLPSCREFLSAAVLAINNHRISWMSINRSSGYRVDDRHSVSCLALLVAAGVVDPAMNWQHQHVTTDRALKAITPLLQNAEQDGLIGWSRAVVKSLRQSYEALLEPGWTADELMEPLFDALSQSSICDDMPEAEAISEIDEYQLLKRQLRDDLSLDRLRARIESRSVSSR